MTAKASAAVAAALRAIAAYDALLFDSVGRPADPVRQVRLDTLAALASHACEEAAAARVEPAWVRAEFKEQAGFFASQVLG